MLAIGRRVLAVVAFCLATLIGPAGPAAAVPDEDGQWDPCGGAAACQHEVIEVWGTLPWWSPNPYENLGVVGVRVGDDVLGEYVYNDGTGPRPVDGWLPYGWDVFQAADWGLRIPTPVGTHEVTVYWKNVDGTLIEELTRTMTSPTPPGPVEVVAEELRPGVVHFAVSRYRVFENGALVRLIQLRTKGRRDSFYEYMIPSGARTERTYRRLSPGWHTFRARSSNVAGWGPWVSTRIWVHRRR